jgi:hypothetical protein
MIITEANALIQEFIDADGAFSKSLDAMNFDSAAFERRVVAFAKVYICLLAYAG